MATFPAGSRALGSVSYLDAGGERASVRFFLPIPTSANINDLLTEWAALLTALDAITLGARVSDTYVDETTYAVSRPTNGAAREIALQLIFRSTATGQTWTSNVPTLDVSQITYDPNYGAQDVVILEDGAAVEALVTALNAFPAKNPYDATYADNVVVVGARVVRGLK